MGMHSAEVTRVRLAVWTLLSPSCIHNSRWLPTSTVLDERSAGLQHMQRRALVTMHMHIRR